MATAERCGQQRTLALEYETRISLALQQNDVPVIRALRLTPDAGLPLPALTITSDLPVLVPWEQHLAPLSPGGQHTLADLPRELSAPLLAGQTERARPCI